MALKSLLYEVAATPKPGLVDRNNSGAHKDMDFFTFMASSASLAYYFYKCLQVGSNIFQKKENINLLEYIRPEGLKGEAYMNEATGGVNTHKGLIFSMGLICFAIGLIYQEKGHGKLFLEEVIEKIKEITFGITQKELTNLESKENNTYGKKVYVKYGLTGIRGEVEAGFPTVCEVGLPRLIELRQEKILSWNDCLVQVLLELMTVSQDTNVVARHDLNMLKYVQKKAKEVLKLGGMKTPGGRQAILAMDKDFIQKNISPGGTADLLAVTIMFFLIEGNI